MSGLEVIGFQLLSQHGRDLVLVGAFLSIGWGVGIRVVRWIYPGERSAAERVYALPVGHSILALAILVLGTVGWLGRVPLALMLTGAAVFGFREVRSSVATVLVNAKSIGNGSPHSALTAVLVAVSAAIAGFFVVMALAPPTDWDALMYHLRLPQQFLEAGRIYLPPDNLHVAFIGVMQLLYIPLLTFGSPAAPALLSAAFAMYLAWAVFAVGRSLLGYGTGALASIVLWGTTTIILVAITPRNDVSLALWLFAAHVALIHAARSDGDTRALPVAGFLAGSAFGIKYHALAYTAGLFPIIVWVLISRYADRSTRLRAVTVAGAAFLVGVAPWAIKNWVMLGSPVFPFLGPGTLEPWLAELYGTPIIPESVDPQTLTALSQVRAPFNLLDAFFAPWQITVEAEGARYFLSPILLGVPLWFLVRRSDVVNWLAFPAIFYLIAIIVPLPSTNLRYLIAAVPALTLVVAHAFVHVSRLGPRLAGLVIAFVVVVGLYRVPGVVISRLTRTQAVPYVLGQSSANEYLDTHFDTGVGRLMAVARWADTASDPHAKILMLFDARGYYFRREVIQDIRVSNWPLFTQSPGGKGCLEGTEITHVLVSTGVVNYYALRGLSPRTIRWDQFESFREQCLEPALDVGGFVVFAVRPRGG